MGNARITGPMRRAIEQYETTGSWDGVHHHTRAALERRGLVSDPSPVAEVIGQEQSYDYRWFDNHPFRVQPSLDARRGDYGFWDRARKGRVDKLRLAGAFLKPLGSKVATWTLGATPKFSSENDDLPGLVGEWWMQQQAEIMRAYNESLDLGDSYMVFNGDGSLTVLPPHIVDPIVDERDFSQTVGYRVVQRYSHPIEVGRYQTIENHYYADRREMKVYDAPGSGFARERRFANPLGEIPVVKLSNDATAGEINGRPLGESILHVLWAYDQVLNAGIAGNLRQGRPTPTLNGITTQQIRDLINLFGVEEEYLDANGRKQTRKRIAFDSDQLMMTQGTFSYSQPGAFVGETEKLLGLLFYLLLQHTEIPEFVWGNAIASSKASAESQMPAFSKFIEGRQTSISHWMTHLLRLAVRWLATFEAGVRDTDEVKITYAPLTGTDGKLTIDAIALGRREGLLDRLTALQLMPLDVDDPAAVLEAIDAEREEEREALEARRVAQVERDTGFEDEEEEPSVADELRVLETRVIKEAHTGAMAAFFIPQGEAEQLHRMAVMSMGEYEVTPVHEMHITLAYLGEAADLDRKRVEAAISSFADTNMPLTGKVSGLGRFTQTHREGYDAIYASFDSPDLPQFRQNLVRTLMDNGVEPDRAHGFTPHITLAYIPSDASMPNLRVPATSVRFAALSLAWGDEHQHYHLMVPDAIGAAA